MSIQKLTKVDKYLKVGRRVTALAGGITGAPITATPGNGYTYYTFTSPGTATAVAGGLSFNDAWDSQVISGASSAGGAVSYEFLIVAGGGGGGTGGGGAGGVVVSTSPFPASSPLSILVGPGGTQFYPGSPTPTPATPGGDSYIDSSIGLIVAKGGGFGDQGPGAVGGNGGGYTAGGWSRIPGGSANQPSQNPGIANILQYGNPGGNGAFYNGGGGGGAGAAGQDAQATGFTNGTNQPSYGGNGQPFPLYEGTLIGLPSVSPFSGTFAGGGGGGSGRDGWVNNAGAAPKPPHVPGGGGKSADHNGSAQQGNAQAGIDYLGGGGGGQSWFGGPTPFSQPGGKGVVVLRVPV